MTTAWQERWKFIQEQVDHHLNAELVARMDAPSAIREAMHYSLLAPGKRLRPLLAILACEAAGGTIEQALPGACAIEMIHTYSLIHDDLPAMDDDDLRRGRPTCHKQYGEALAILAGDALLTLAFEVIAQRCPAKTASVSILELARGAGMVGMVGGQVLDLAAENRLDAQLRMPTPETVGDLENIHRRKTGALLVTALRLGLYAAQAERSEGFCRSTLEQFDVYGRSFGLAFQITDDLLDVQGSTAEVGKRVGKDAERGKLTYPGLLGIQESRQRADVLCRLAVEAVTPLGPAGGMLAQVAMYLLDRDR
ncbi:polyprenyl synthetase family protein [Tuwongella immobilis]|uniref:Uncharacterized protein n=1 Tax=Tuwongella immobilis TaxID=692036 RepID=A0A6C2YP76_9BACT|nr:farnesyl diphosphate synthase [Tuwongella immobilis]VIP02682.1 farnesyl-diphosphate synthase : Polyprenyl synthetase OS=Planctomyces maris DSM 8797 GN=PM8797T_17514 PE=3 SV=1: polyprenyl_synt [Tuwongella immobilis]VTS02135.1 farnesyl-diphosphate synthase : Polyprenyl synthetase OS=Planctomyces maris DSM 8797 GN=PM8797T_17514 PE=3 SV=1: polyprenyl_synt [Tuwongella immobilis]